MRTEERVTRSVWVNPAVLIPMVLVIIAAAARGLCQAMHVDPHVQAMILATIVNVVAAEVALLPLLFTRGASQLAVVQSGLISTVIQMFVAAALSGVALYAFRVGPPFVYWVIPQYWVALAILVAGLVSAIKRADPLQTKAANP